MAEALKVLGQVAPVATTITDLYTVPALSSAVVSTLVVCNRNIAGRDRFRVAVAVAGAADSVEQYIFWDTQITNRNTLTFTLGITLGAADVLRVYADNTDLSFSVFGTEIS